jgi:hypothetical protein
MLGSQGTRIRIPTKWAFTFMWLSQGMLPTSSSVRMPRRNWLQLLAVLWISFVQANDTVISLPTRCLGRATVRIHYHQPQQRNGGGTTTTKSNSHNNDCRSTLILVGVGTAMKVNDYDALGVAMASQLPTAIVAIVNPTRSFIKLNPITLDARPFANAVNRVVSRLLESSSSLSSLSRRRIWDPSLLPADANLCPLNATTTVFSRPGTSLRILVGGHSASGAAAFYALGHQLYDFDVAGLLSLDPFPIRSDDPPAARSSTTITTTTTVPSIPTLAWGLSATTCKVTVAEAAVAAYEHARPNRRVLYQVQNSIPGESSSSSCILSHCQRWRLSLLRQCMQCHGQSRRNCRCRPIGATLCRGPGHHHHHVGIFPTNV